MSVAAGLAILAAWLLFNVGRGGDPKQIEGGLFYAAVFALWFCIRRFVLRSPRTQGEKEESAEKL